MDAKPSSIIYQYSIKQNTRSKPKFEKNEATIRKAKHKSKIADNS